MCRRRGPSRSGVGGSWRQRLSLGGGMGSNEHEAAPVASRVSGCYPGGQDGAQRCVLGQRAEASGEMEGKKVLGGRPKVVCRGSEGKKSARKKTRALQRKQGTSFGWRFLGPRCVACRLPDWPKNKLFIPRSIHRCGSVCGATRCPSRIRRFKFAAERLTENRPTGRVASRCGGAQREPTHRL